MRRERGYMDLTGAFWGLMILGVIVGVVAALVIPWLWRLIKPWIHAVTS